MRTKGGAHRGMLKAATVDDAPLIDLGGPGSDRQRAARVAAGQAGAPAASTRSLQRRKAAPVSGPGGAARAASLVSAPSWRSVHARPATRHAKEPTGRTAAPGPPRGVPDRQLRPRQAFGGVCDPPISTEHSEQLRKAAKALAADTSASTGAQNLTAEERDAGAALPQRLRARCAGRACAVAQPVDTGRDGCAQASQPRANKRQERGPQLGKRLRAHAGVMIVADPASLTAQCAKRLRRSQNSAAANGGGACGVLAQVRHTNLPRGAGGTRKPLRAPRGAAARGAASAPPSPPCTRAQRARKGARPAAPERCDAQQQGQARHTKVEGAAQGRPPAVASARTLRARRLARQAAAQQAPTAQRATGAKRGVAQSPRARETGTAGLRAQRAEARAAARAQEAACELLELAAECSSDSSASCGHPTPPRSTARQRSLSLCAHDARPLVVDGAAAPAATPPGALPALHPNVTPIRGSYPLQPFECALGGEAQRTPQYRMTPLECAPCPACCTTLSKQHPRTHPEPRLQVHQLSGLAAAAPRLRARLRAALDGARECVAPRACAAAYGPGGRLWRRAADAGAEPRVPGPHGPLRGRAAAGAEGRGGAPGGEQGVAQGRGAAAGPGVLSIAASVRVTRGVWERCVRRWQVLQGCAVCYECAGLSVSAEQWLLSTHA